MLREIDAEKLECPYKDKMCITDKCMGWEWFSQYEDVAYENSALITEKRINELHAIGYEELPGHWGGFVLKNFFPMTEEELIKAKDNQYGTQRFFGLPTKDRSQWIGSCKCCSSGE